MPGDRPSRQVPAWKKGVTQGKSETVAKHAWQREKEEAPQATSRWSLWSKRGLAVGGFVGALVVLVLVILWLLPPKPATLILLGDDYVDELALPHNIYGMNAARGLEDIAKGSDSPVFWWGSGTLQLRQGIDRPKPDASLGMKLGKIKEKTLVIYLAVHGGADSNGPFLYVKDAADWKHISLKDVIAQLGNGDLAENNKLLILDATQVTTSWPVGLLHNDFARKLEGLDDDIAAVPNLVVMSANDIGQRSWISEEWQRSIFGHFVVEGLHGAGRSENDRIRGDLLYDFVKDKVSQWVRDNRGAEQVPVLLPKKDDEGRRRAGKMELAVVKDKYAGANAADAPGAAYKPPEKLGKAWERGQELARLTPGPWVYAPHLWHRYLDTLKRYEDVVRAGDAAAAERVHGKLETMATELIQARRLDLGCVQNALPMAAVLGLTSEELTGTEVAKRFEELWAAPDTERAGRWSKAKEWARGIVEGGDRLLRLRFNGLAIDRVAERADTLQQACNLLPLLNDETGPRPAEAHYLAMIRDVLGYLARIADPASKIALPPELLPALSKSLRVRVLAEQVALASKSEPQHPYSETVYQWIKSDVEAADALRRGGEDELFLSEKENWDSAARQLDAAEKKYQAAYAQAQVVRTACQTRDRLLASLPYYSRWLALRRQFVVREVDVEGLWKEVHRLAYRLEKPDPQGVNEIPRPDKDDDVPLRLVDRVSNLRRDFDKIEKECEETCDKLRGDSIVPSRWFEIEDVLAVPFIDPAVRANLVRNSRRISRTFNDEPGRAKWPEAPPTLAREAARGQGRMALAVLGERRINEGTGHKRGLDHLELVRLINTELNPWWNALILVGEQVGPSFATMPQEIRKLTEEAGAGDLTKAAEAMIKAERLCRQLDGSAPDVPNAVLDYRKLNTHRLLLWQGHRTYLDFWAERGRTATPYYRFAGGRYLDDAKKLLADISREDVMTPQERTDRQSELVKGQRELVPTALRLNCPAHLDYTTEEKLTAQFNVETGPLVPTGTMVIQVEAEGAQESPKLLELLGPKDNGRIALKLGGNPATASLECQFKSPYLEEEAKKPSTAGEARNAALLVRGVYRGHKQDLDPRVAVDLHPIADLDKNEHALPRTSGIAVRAEGPIHERYAVNNSAIVILLDCSGSMRTLQARGGTRLDEARKALRKVLRELPEGVRVSLWVFSQEEKALGNNVDAERTVKRLHDRPIIWGQNPGDFDDLMAKVDRLVPVNNTPIVHAMMKAKEDFNNVSGFKTMVILTDGMDTCFERRKYPPKVFDGESQGDYLYNKTGTRKISEFLIEQFKDKPMAIDFRMVGFQLDTEEAQLSKDQFGEAMDALKGKLHYVNQTSELIDKLKDALRQKRLTFRLEDRRGVPVMLPGVSQEGYEISRADAGLEWYKPLPHGLYRARVATYSQDIQTGPGDLLLSTLTRDERFERVVFSKERRNASKPFRETGDWRMAVLKNQYTAGGSAEMLVTVEDYKSTLADPMGTLQQIHPGFMWMEVTPKGMAKSVPVHWGNVTGYPAPAYRVEALGWTDGVAPVLEAWWIKDTVPQAHASVARDLTRSLQADFKQPREHRVEGDRFTIENVSYERLFVEIVPGERRQRDCLVVRGSYDAGRPVLVRLRGPEINPEHLFYTRAGKYTGIFYPVTRDQAEKQPFSLEMTSIEAFKNSRGVTHVKIDDLEPPNLDDKGPQRESLPLPD
jgi:Mg-chelatase subunit ChlD